MALHAELRAAVRSLTALGRPSPAALAGGLAFYPLVGLGLGAVAAAAAAGLGKLPPLFAGPGGVLVLAALGGGRGTLGLAAAAAALLGPGERATALARLRAHPGPLGRALAAAALLARMAAAAMLPAPARTAALLVAPMLGAWGVVVQCYGGTPVHARGPAAALVGRARFREFAWASVTALGVTLALGDAVGLVVVVAAALVTLGLRVVAHRRLGGLTGRLLAATRELVETVVLVTLGLLAQLNT